MWGNDENENDTIQIASQTMNIKQPEAYAYWLNIIDPHVDRYEYYKKHYYRIFANPAANSAIQNFVKCQTDIQAAYTQVNMYNYELLYRERSGETEFH